MAKRFGYNPDKPYRVRGTFGGAHVYKQNGGIGDIVLHLIASSGLIASVKDANRGRKVRFVINWTANATEQIESLIESYAKTQRQDRRNAKTQSLRNVSGTYAGGSRKGISRKGKNRSGGSR